MKKTFNKWLLALLPITAFTARSTAQSVNKDSLSLVNKISEDREKLAKLQATIPEKEKAKAETAQQAQRSADDNRKAANRLSNDPQDRKLARRADREAGDARSDAKKARSASDDLDDTYKDIRKLTSRIEKEQKKLDGIVEKARNRPAPAEEH